LKKKNESLITGISRNPRLKGKGDSFRIKNLRLDKKFAGLTNDRGWISYGIETNSAAVPNEDVTSIYSWDKQQGENYLLFETEDYINVLDSQMSDNILITKNSNTFQVGPNPYRNTSPTIYLPLGKHLGIFNINGYAPQKFYGKGRLSPFGFTSKPNPPLPIGPTGRADLGSCDPANIGANDFFYSTTGDKRSVLNGVDGTGNKLDIVIDPRNNAGLGNTSLTEDGDWATIPAPTDSTPDADYVQPTFHSKPKRMSSYSYKVSFISETGSESPLSDASPVINWYSPRIIYDQTVAATASGLVTFEAAVYHTYKYIIPLTNVPRGPDGTISRRLYRTRNMVGEAANRAIGIDLSTNENFFFLDDIPNNLETDYIDMISDNSLGSQAPRMTDSVIVSLESDAVTTFQGRTLLARGNEIIYSQVNAPEQFGSLNKLTVTLSDGDKITGLAVYKDLCIVLKTNGVDVITQSPFAEGYLAIKNISNTAGCIAPKTAKVITGTGLIYLAKDGFKKLTMTDGGASSIIDISIGLETYVDEINDVVGIRRAEAVYNERDREYWCTAPVNGAVYNNRGFILNLDSMGWSLREDVPAQCLTYGPEGYVIFGSNARKKGVGTATTLNAQTGLQVWQGIPTNGAIELLPETYQLNAPLTNEYVSDWFDFDSPEAIKKVFRVEIQGMLTGDVVATLDSFADFDRAPAQRITSAVTNQTTKLQSYERERYGQFDNAILDDASSLTAIPTIGQKKNYSGDYQFANIRFDIPSLSSRYFQFSLNASGPMYIYGYTIFYDQKGVMKTLSYQMNDSTNNIRVY